MDSEENQLKHTQGHDSPLLGRVCLALLLGSYVVPMLFMKLHKCLFSAKATGTPSAPHKGQLLRSPLQLHH